MGFILGALAYGAFVALSATGVVATLKK